MLINVFLTCKNNQTQSSFLYLRVIGETLDREATRPSLEYGRRSEGFEAFESVSSLLTGQGKCRDFSLRQI